MSSVSPLATKVEMLSRPSELSEPCTLVDEDKGDVIKKNLRMKIKSRVCVIQREVRKILYINAYIWNLEKRY